ncbi:hypothetical protein B0A52_00107 [Exophiala mesophila]|uniref:Mitochondrial K+-H+ exchange-related-domain-containing protein n=1 Tax=Exophiala mesophila TaxID=212818 RepID=A0A438NJ46_EXOME|nr:hypothetical protein B0A52_00107 [Exophiala mesophila]
MRLFLLPLSTRQALVYCQRAAKAPGAESSYGEKIQQKAAETWAKWETAKSGWKKQIVTYGNRGLQRIPYQEWSLKSFPPSNPNLQAEHLVQGKRFDVIYPGNVMRQEDVPRVLARLARERKQLHWNRFIGSMVAIPFTVPFALIPIIPNVPFFYAVYRCWSHWRALKGSDHLDFILDHRLIKPQSPDHIEELYQQVAPHSPDFHFVTASQIEDGTAPPDQLILTADSHDLVAKTLGVPELSGEIERAVWQVERQLAAERKAAQVSKDGSPNNSKTKT